MTFKIQKHRILTMPSEAPLPPLRKMAVTAAKDAIRVISHAVSTGRVWSNPEEKAKRDAICPTCLWWRPSDNRCGHPDCGCKLVLKAALEKMKCPDNPPKW